MPHTAAWTLVNDAGHELEGNIVVSERASSQKAVLTGGWGRFVKANKLKVDDSVTFDFFKGNVLRITKGGEAPPVAPPRKHKGESGPQPKKQKTQGAPQHRKDGQGPPVDGKAGPRASNASLPGQQAEPSATLAAEGGAAAAPSASDPVRAAAAAAASTPQDQQQQQRQQQEAAPESGEGLQYIGKPVILVSQAKLCCSMSVSPSSHCATCKGHGLSLRAAPCIING